MPGVAIGGMIAVCAAILALLLLWGVQSFVKAVAGIIPRDLPVIGSRLHDLVEGIAAAAMAVIQWTMAEVITPVISFILSPVYRMLDLLNGLETFAVNAADAWRWLLRALPEAMAKAANYIDGRILALDRILRGVISAARAYALRLYHAAIGEAHHLYHLAEAFAAREVAALDAKLVKVIAGVDAAAHSLVHAARLYAAELVHTARVDLTKAVAEAEALTRSEVAAVTKLVSSTAATTLSAAEKFTAASVGAVVGVLTVDIPNVVEPVYDGLIEDVGVLQGVLATDFPELSALLDSLPAVGSLDLAGALTGTLTMTRVMTRYMERCGVPNCRNLSAIGRALQDLFGLVEGAAFLAFLAELIADPQGAAREIDDVLTPIVDPLVAGARELLGV